MSERTEQLIELLQIIKARHDPATVIQTKERREYVRKLRRCAEIGVANRRDIDVTTVSDKYRRRLEIPLNTDEFDGLVVAWLFKGPGKLQHILLESSTSSQDRQRVKRFFSATQTSPTPVANDISESSRAEVHIYRVLRDTALAREIKAAQGYKCQLCGNDGIKLSDGELYAEAHHVKPLGAPHNGPDVGENIICVCPNCHVLLDFGSIRLKSTELKQDISDQYIKYHNEQICDKRRRST